MDDWESQVNALYDPSSVATADQPKQVPQEELAKQAVEHVPDVDREWQDRVNALVDPEYQHKQLAGYREKYKEYEEPLIGRIAQSSLPFVSSIFGIGGAEEYKAAKQRFDEGNGTDRDAKMIALYERGQQEESKRGWADKTVSGLLNIPAMAGEAYMTGGLFPAAKGALGYIATKVAQTPLMPSLYAGQAAERSAQQGGETYDPKNLAPSIAMGALQNVVLGAAGKFTSGIANPLKRFAAGVGVGTGELEATHVLGGIADEFLPEAYQTHTAYGVMGDLRHGRMGDAMQKATVDVLTMAAFQVLHGNKYEAKKTLDSAQKTLDEQANNKATADEAAKVLQAKISAEMEKAGGPKQGDQETRQAIKEVTGNDSGDVPDADALQAQLDALKSSDKPVTLNAAEGPFDPAVRVADIAQQYTRAQENLRRADAEVETQATRKKRLQTHTLAEAEADREAWSKKVSELAVAHSEAMDAVEKAKVPQQGPTPGYDYIHPEYAGHEGIVTPRKTTIGAGDEHLNALVEALGEETGPTKRLDNLFNAAKLTNKQKYILYERAKNPDRTHEEIGQDEEMGGVDRSNIQKSEKDARRKIQKVTGKPFESTYNAIVKADADANLQEGKEARSQADQGKGAGAVKDNRSREEIRLDDWFDYLTELQNARHRKLTAQELEEFDLRIQSGEVAPGSKTAGANGEPVESPSVRPQVAVNVQSRPSPSPETAPAQVEGQQVGAASIAGQREATGGELIPDATKKFLADVASSGNKYYLAKVEQEMLDHYPDAEVKAAVKEAKKTPRSEVPTGFENIGPQGRGRNAQNNAMILRGEIRDELQRHQAGEEYHNVLTEKGTLPTETVKGLAEQVRVQNQATGKAEGIEAIAKDTGRDPTELKRLVDADDSDISFDFGANVGEPIGRPGEPGGRNGLTVPEAAANESAGRQILNKAIDLFTKSEEEGTLPLPFDPAVAREKFIKAARYAYDGIGRVASYTNPAISRLSHDAGRAVYALTAVKGAIEKQQQYFPDIVLGKGSTDAQERLAGSTMMEMRFRQAKNNRLRDAAADLNDARKAAAVGDIDSFNLYQKSAAKNLQAAKDTTTAIGMKDSPLKTAADYVAALQDPYVKQAISNYKGDYVQSKEMTYRDSQGLNATDPINSNTQIKDMPIMAIPLDADGNLMGGPKKPGAEGNLRNTKLRKNPSSYQATLAHDTYELNLRKIINADIERGLPLAAKAKAYRTLESEGLGEWRAPGDKGPNDDGTLANGKEARLVEDVSPPKNTQANAQGEKNFYIDKEAYGEFRNALATDERMAFTRPLAAAMYVPNIAALASSVELITHGMSLAGSALHKADFRDIIKKPMDFYSNLHGFITSDPTYKAKIMDMANRGRVKAGEERPGLLVPNWLETLIPGLQAKDPTSLPGKFLHAYDEIVRATLSDGYDRLADRGHVSGTEEDKTNFIQSLAGNYNRGSMSSFTKFLKDSSLQPFATPAAGMTLRSIRSLVGGGPGEPTSLASNIHLRASVIAQLVALPVAGMLSNYVTTGQVMPDGIPYGALYIYTDDKGQKHYFDLLQIIGAKRGLNALGGLPYVESLRQGHSAAHSLDEAKLGSVHAMLHTVFGPGPNFVWTALTGKDFFGRQVSKTADTESGETQFGQDVKTAAMRANPVVSSFTGADEPTRETTLGDKAWKMLGGAGMKTAAPWRHPDVNRFYEAFKSDMDAFKENATSQKKEGLKAKEPKGLVVLNEAAKKIGELDRRYNNPLIARDMKEKIRDAQGQIARAALMKRKAINELLRQTVPAK